ncbi:MAG: ABC transporter substrate-binding protein [Clostridiales bacterium]|nr:ABC transporter substrate-binding protein [Clostridiales bacterium]
MKKIIALVLVALLALSAAAFADTTIKVAASPTPHAIILEKAAELLKDKGITLKITEFTDYVQPNMVVESGEFDANYFQHVPYLNDFNAQNGTHLVSVAEIHYEPFGIYPGKTASFEELADGAQIAVPNDGTNEARALILLEAQGLIKLREGAGMGAIKADIIENPKNLDIVEMEAAQLPRTLNSVDMAVINGNYALQAGLSVTTDAIASEDAESVGAQTYANILVVKEGNENNEAILALVEVLKSEEIKEAILAEYSGSVVPLT